MSNIFRIRDNKANSPLLQLPSEIREKILVNVLGGNLIHVSYIEESTDKRNDHLAKQIHKDVEIAGLSHAICIASQPDQSTFQNVVSRNIFDSDDDSWDENPASFYNRHANCKTVRHGPSLGIKTNLKIDLRVLGACRQLYEEANHLLWKTNTFSFDRPLSFDQFLASLNPAQKHQIGSLQISAYLVILRGFSTHWSQALKMAHINTLKGVRDLQLCLEYTYFNSIWEMEPSVQTIMEALENDAEPFMRLRALDLKTVTVDVIAGPENCSRHQSSDESITPLLTTYAEEVRSRLLDSGGADQVKVDTEANKASNRLALQRKAERKVKYAKDALTTARKLADRAATKVAVLEDEAIKSGAEAKTIVADDDEGEKEVLPQVKACELDAEIERMKQYAEWKAGALQGLEEHVEKRAAIHERATARVEGRKVARLKKIRKGIKHEDHKQEETEECNLTKQRKNEDNHPPYYVFRTIESMLKTELRKEEILSNENNEGQGNEERKEELRTFLRSTVKEMKHRLTTTLPKEVDILHSVKQRYLRSFQRHYSISTMVSC